MNHTTDKEVLLSIIPKYLFKTSDGIRIRWNNVIEEYEQITGHKRAIRTLQKYVTADDRERLWKESRGNLPTESENGLHYDKRFIELDKETRYTQEDILLAHGFDPNEFDISSAGSTGSKIGTKPTDEYDKDYFINTYQKITVKPKEFKLTQEVLERILNKTNINPIIIEPKVSEPNGLLTIPLFDMHFGINTYEDYKGHQAEIYKYISNQEWEEVLFIIGQDLMHNDDFKGFTSNQTRIEQVDIEIAWEDAMKFYQPLIEEALAQSLNVKIIFSRGNHDQTLGWAFVKMLERLYPGIEFDSNQQEYKSHTFKNVFIGVTHGDKSNDKKLAQVFNSLFRLPMAKAKRRIIFRGHLHTQKTIDEFGTTIMGLGTAAATDQWHEDNGYVGNNKSFEIFIFNDDSLKGHMFIDGR